MSTFRIREVDHVFPLEDVHFLDTRDHVDLHALEAVLQLCVITSDCLVRRLLLSAST